MPTPPSPAMTTAGFWQVRPFDVSVQRRPARQSLPVCARGADVAACPRCGSGSRSPPPCRAARACSRRCSRSRRRPRPGRPSRRCGSARSRACRCSRRSGRTPAPRSRCARADRSRPYRAARSGSSCRCCKPARPPDRRAQGSSSRSYTSTPSPRARRSEAKKNDASPLPPRFDDSGRVHPSAAASAWNHAALAQRASSGQSAGPTSLSPRERASGRPGANPGRSRAASEQRPHAGPTLPLAQRASSDPNPDPGPSRAASEQRPERRTHAPLASERAVTPTRHPGSSRAASEQRPAAAVVASRAVCACAVTRTSTKPLHPSSTA